MMMMMMMMISPFGQFGLLVGALFRGARRIHINRVCFHMTSLTQLRGVTIPQRLSVASNVIDHPSLGHLLLPVIEELGHPRLGQEAPC
jgi:hypothetical protein